MAPSGGRWWRLKYRHGGKEKRLSLGTYPDTPLKSARERRDQARRLLAEGIDPSQARQAEKAQAARESEHPFEAVARAWVEHQSGAWTAETRDRVLQRVRAVFRFAVVHEYIDSNPIQDLQRSELLKPKPVTHRAALPEAELPLFLVKLAACDGHPTTLHAMQLLLLTAVRPGELRGARWAEFDLAAALWRIPAERMKMRTEHLVPLSRQALQVLEAQRQWSATDPLVFPSPYYPGKPISENTLNSALARMGYKGMATAHGFRALFSTVANERGHSPDVIERQLAHVERNAVRAAYHRSSCMKDRAALLQWWADHVDGCRPSLQTAEAKAAAGEQPEDAALPA